MKIKNELKNLNQNDLFSIVLFVLYKLIDSPEYSVISEMAYILDRKNLLKLCEYFGGMTLKIPTIQELEQITCALLLYQLVNIENKTFSDSLELIKEKYPNTKNIKAIYVNICEILENYTFENKYHIDTVKEHI